MSSDSTGYFDPHFYAAPPPLAPHIVERLEADARRRSDERATAVERACEVALQTGTHGVLVTGSAVDLMSSFAVEVSPESPYGFITYRPGGAATL